MQETGLKTCTCESGCDLQELTLAPVTIMVTSARRIAECLDGASPAICAKKTTSIFQISLLNPLQTDTFVKYSYIAKKSEIEEKAGYKTVTLYLPLSDIMPVGYWHPYSYVM